MIDHKHIGTEYEPATLYVDPWRIRFFAKAIGETNPIYFDTEAARIAGYKNIVAPPTFAFSLELEEPAGLFSMAAEIGADLRYVLHGEQSFHYHVPIVAGDTLTRTARLLNVEDKKGGAMQIVTREARVVNQNGELAAELSAQIVVRNPR